MSVNVLSLARTSIYVLTCAREYICSIVYLLDVLIFAEISQEQ